MMGLDVENQKAEYREARDRVDAIIDERSEEITALLNKIARIRSTLLYLVIKDWEHHLSQTIPTYGNILTLGPSVITALNKAYVDYITYAFYLRYGTGLRKNILLRKILSFEIHYFCEREVFPPILVTPQSPALPADEALFYTSPTIHFMNFRLIKEIQVRMPSNAWAAMSMGDSVRTIVETVTSEMLEFAVKFARNGARPKLDDFQDFIKNRKIEEFISWAENRDPHDTLHELI